MANQDLQDQKGKRVKQGTSAQGVLKATRERMASWAPGDPQGQRVSLACKGRRVMMASQGNQDLRALRGKKEAQVRRERMARTARQDPRVNLARRVELAPSDHGVPLA